MTKQEIWKDIPGYEGKYWVSNMGRVKSRNKIMKQSKTKDDYFKITLSNPNKSIRIHRIVSEVFIENPENKPLVNHINGIKTDNKADNLEWVTNSENAIHSMYILKNNIRPVIALKNGKIIFEFESMSKAKEFGFKPNIISIVCSGKINSHKGFQWQYKTPETETLDRITPQETKTQQLTIFDSI